MEDELAQEDGKTLSAAWVCDGDHPGVDLPLSVPKGEACSECGAREPTAAENLDAQFECGCWFSKVGAQRHPAITGTMCCPTHLKPYGENPSRRPMPGDSAATTFAWRYTDEQGQRWRLVVPPSSSTRAWHWVVEANG